MPWRLWRRVKIAPGVTMNISKSGLSTSFGPRGAKVTLGHGRIRKTVGLPGTGLFYTTTSKVEADDSLGPTDAGEQAPKRASNGSSGRGRGRSRFGWLGWAVGIFIALGIIGSLTGVGGSPSATGSPPPGALGLLGFAGGSTGSVSSPPVATSGPAQTARPKPTATPKPTTTPKPTSKPAALALKITKAPGSVSRNAFATLTAKTAPGARCSIEVDYASGPSSASGLSDKTANSSGYVSWTWKVGGNTTKGTWPIYVSCSYKGQVAQRSSSVTVI